MKLRIEELPLGFGFRCIDDNTYDGAPDAGPQMVGEGMTAEAARQDFWDQWLERESERDVNRALKQMKVWDSFFDQIIGGRP
jgi:hypothetical protein